MSCNQYITSTNNWGINSRKKDNPEVSPAAHTARIPLSQNPMHHGLRAGRVLITLNRDNRAPTEASPKVKLSILRDTKDPVLIQHPWQKGRSPPRRTRFYKVDTSCHGIPSLA